MPLAFLYIKYSFPIPLFRVVLKFFSKAECVVIHNPYQCIEFCNLINNRDVKGNKWFEIKLEVFSF